MRIATDGEHNLGYVQIVPNAEVAYSVAFDRYFVGDFDDANNLVGIELLDARSCKPGDLQEVMSRAKAESVSRAGQGQPGKRSAWSRGGWSGQPMLKRWMASLRSP